ncbi:MAG: hypothetical protein JWO84_732, partial [Parcubacteria group bacterium]|nr:hypothetical protein [Parcubacteria group bacterium]
MSLPLDKKFIPNKVAAELSGYNSDYISRLCREGKIEGVQMGRAWFVNRESLEKFMRLQEERKKEISRELSRSREEEYKKHSDATQPVATVIPFVKPTQVRKVNAAQKSIAGPRLSEIHPALRHGFAVAVTVLVVASAAYGAETGIVNRLGEKVIASAIATHGGEREIPEQAVVAVYRLGDMLSAGTSATVGSAPR